MAEIESTADRVKLSKADVMRQSMRLGLPHLRKKLSPRNDRLTNVEALPDAVLARLYRQRVDDEDSIRKFIAAQPNEAD